MWGDHLRLLAEGDTDQQGVVLELLRDGY